MESYGGGLYKTCTVVIQRNTAFRLVLISENYNLFEKRTFLQETITFILFKVVYLLSTNGYAICEVHKTKR